jgi:hypothetical protein
MTPSTPVVTAPAAVSWRKIYDFIHSFLRDQIRQWRPIGRIESHRELFSRNMRFYATLCRTPVSMLRYIKPDLICDLQIYAAYIGLHSKSGFSRCGGGVVPIWEFGILSRGLWLSYPSRSYRNSAEFNPKASPRWPFNKE